VDAPFGRGRARLGKQRLETRVVAGAVARLNLPLNELRRSPRRCRGRRASHRLLANPRVTASVELLTISGAPASVRARAGALVSAARRRASQAIPSRHRRTRYGDRGLHRGDRPDIAQPLVRNPSSATTTACSGRLIQQVGGDSVTCHAALAIYAARWRLERELPSIDRARPLSESIGCAGPPTERLALPRSGSRISAARCSPTQRARHGGDITWDVPGTGEAGTWSSAAVTGLTARGG